MSDQRINGRMLLRSAALACVRQYLAFALRTTRWTLSIAPRTEKLLTGQDGSTPIVVFWHEMLLFTPALWWWAEPLNQKLRLTVLISRNNDGRLIADVISPWRIASIAGSSDSKGKSKGGAAAFRRMCSTLKQGGVVAITPDGPKGPRHMVHPGTVALAAAAGQPIVPIGAHSFGWRLNTWDRLVVPFPFGKGRLVCGDPIEVKSKAEGELASLRCAINTQMHYAHQKEIDSSLYMHSKLKLKPLSLTPSLFWHVAASCIAPALPFFLRWRQGRGKELPTRVREKMGFASLHRPEGKLLWFHAASVGEALSILPLIQSCLQKRSQLNALITTGTVTAASIIQERIENTNGCENIRHQFLPLDVPRWGQRFLTHWQPDALILTESDLWPNLIGLCHKRSIPVVLVNARMSEKSFKFWQKSPAIFQSMVERFAWIAPRSTKEAEYFASLSKHSAGPVGDIKTAAHPLPVKQSVLESVRQKIGNRPIFLAASTHEGEEAVIAEAVNLLTRKHPSLLAIVVPRHPERGALISAFLGNAPRRSCNKWPESKDAIWVCDTLGELGLFYSLAHCAFIGNSLPEAKSGGGGHNPFEPVRLHCPVSTGPLVQNFEEAFRELRPAVATVHGADGLAHWVSMLLAEPALAEKQANTALSIIAQHSVLLEELTQKILALLPA